MKRRWISGFGGLTLAVFALGCGASGHTMSLSRYVAASGNEAAWKGFAPGTRYVLYAPKGSCQVRVAKSLGELEQGGGQSLDSLPFASSPNIVEIRDVFVRSGDKPFLAAQIAGEKAEILWLGLPAGASQACLQAVPKELAAARELLQKELAFTPWHAECTALEAVGRSPSAMLIDAEGDLSFKVEGLALGPASAQAFADGKPGNRVWATLGNGALEVRFDVLQHCFSSPGSARAKPPQSPLGFLRTSETRCESSSDEGKPHIECRTTVGVWQGVSNDRALELHAVRHTLGPVHFLAGKLVSGARYARTVVAVNVATAADSRRQRLYAALTPAIGDALAKDASGVRVADASSPDVTYKIAVELGEVAIGELQKQDSSETSKYKIRDEIKPNPDKPKAQARVDTARDKLRQAEQDYQTQKAQFQQQKQQLIDECNAQAQKAEGWQKVAAASGCAAADALLQPSDSALQAARTELGNAESDLAKTPDTITVPIMGDWQYTKSQFSRSVNGLLRITLQDVGAKQPKSFDTQLKYAWTDYEIAADGAHNVQGHPADHGPIDNPEALVPYIATAASTAIATRFRAALADAQIEAARRAMAAAGLEASKPGFESVDALAFDVVGTRLEKPLIRGASDLAADKPLALPSDAVSLGSDRCLLAVAAASGDAALALRLRTTRGSHADLREAGFATVEICENELAGGKLPSFELSSKSPGPVRWTLYRVLAKAPPRGGS